MKLLKLKSHKLLYSPLVSSKLRPYALAGLLLILALAPLVWWQLRKPMQTQAATLSLSTDGTDFTISVTNRYSATMNTDGTDDYIKFTDSAQGSNQTHEFASPHINETSVNYFLSWDIKRKTTLLESSTTRVKLRVEGCLANATGTCLTDGTNKLTVIEDYTFTPEGVYINNQTDFRATGITLDADSAHQGYEWLGVYTDVTDAAFDDTANILYGDGQTEATLAADGEFTSANSYVVLPGTGSDTYQDAFIGITRTGWLSANGLTHEWNWDENETGTQDLITAQAQAGSSATARVYSATWFFLMKAEDVLDTEAEREALSNDLRNPDLPIYTTGSQWIEGGAVAAGQSPGGASSGLYFDGVNDRVNFGTDTTIDNLPQWTACLWLYLIKPINDGSNPTILAKESGGETWYLWYDNNTEQLTSNWDSTGTTAESSSQTNAISDYQWNHLCSTYNDTGDRKIRLYINGSEISSYNGQQAMTGTRNDNSASDLLLGEGSAGGGDLQGRVDDVRLYNTVLTEAEIRQITSGNNARSANLVGHWTMNENTSSTTFDETTNNNDGTITGATWTTGYLPTQHNQAENAYTFSLASGNRGAFDLDAGANLSTLLNGAVTAGATSTTVDSSTGFPTTGVAWIDGDKHSYTGTTATTFTGIPTTGDLSIIGHADNTVVASMNRHSPFYKLRNWQSLGLTAPSLPPKSPNSTPGARRRWDIGH